MVSGSETAFGALHRPKLYRWISSLKNPVLGSFHMHLPDGECDVRAVYCALLVTLPTNMATKELFQHCSWFVRSCQTHEGGFSGEPGGEAHGAYSFCGAAALTMLRGWGTPETGGCERVLRLFRWLSHRQMMFEGGFQGRIHKLVDGCYSWWIGGCSRVLQLAARQVLGMPPLHESGFDGCASRLSVSIVSAALEPPEASRGLADHVIATTIPPPRRGAVPESAIVPGAAIAMTRAIAEGTLVPFDPARLQSYVLRCCQRPGGGLRDKPSVSADQYHTCYCLCGLSAAQHDAGKGDVPEGESEDDDLSRSSVLPPLDVLCTIRADKSERAIAFFHSGEVAPTHERLLAAAEVEEATAACAAAFEL
jgi:protein farnesyltransferase subunit beta